MGLVHPRASAIAIHAAGADVYQPLGQASPPALALRQRAEQIARARVVNTAVRWRSKMQHRVGQSGDTREAGAIIQIAKQRRRAKRAQPCALGRIAYQRIHPITLGQQWDSPQGDIAAAHNQQSSHGVIMR